MLPTPVLSVSGKGFARLRISAWHFSPAPPILYAVRAIVYHKSRVLSRVLRDFSGRQSPRNPAPEPEAALAVPAAVENATEACPARHWFALPLWHPAGACLACHLLPPAFTFFSAPYPPAPFPGGEGGDFRLFYARGGAPCIPGAEPARHWLDLPLWRPAGGGLPCLPPAAPCLYLLFCPLSPQPPSPVGKGETLGYFMQGAEPLASPGLNPRGTGEGGEPRTRRGCAFGISNSAQNRQNRLSIGSTGSQGEGGPGERNFGV